MISGVGVGDIGVDVGSGVAVGAVVGDGSIGVMAGCRAAFPHAALKRAVKRMTPMAILEDLFTGSSSFLGDLRGLCHCCWERASGPEAREEQIADGGLRWTWLDWLRDDAGGEFG
ncbi:MAG: hypothetical protein CEE40_04665 [Chloroflexi bacterium B3_Chlor]|nr:MAG: hypothetical protein CEE40_04665 [Chloroflexi bacterium B3_Chlor]